MIDRVRFSPVKKPSHDKKKDLKFESKNRKKKKEKPNFAKTEEKYIKIFPYYL